MGAQARTSAPQAAPTCDGLVVSEIVVAPTPPFVRGIPARWQLITRFLGSIHVTSQPDLIRNFLALEVGELCSEFRRVESERILRAQPFIATAAVTTEPDGEGGVRVLVETSDEVTTIFQPRVSLASPMMRGMRLGEGNLMGEGIHASAEWRAGTFGRDSYGVRFIDYQVGNQPYQFGLDARRDQLGGFWVVNMSHPFFTDLQRAGWSAGGGERREYVRFTRDEGDDVAIIAERAYGQVGGIVRVGPPGRLSLFGASLTTERSSTGARTQLITPDGPVPVPPFDVEAARYGDVNATRLNAAWGVRNISFVRVVAFDALTAVQDVRSGFEAGGLAGRSLASLGSTEDDLFVAGDIYAGGGSPRSFLQIEAHGEARQDFNTDEWDSMVSSGRLAWYLHTTPRHTAVVSGEWAGSWSSRVPVALRLGDPDGGVRGYDGSRALGERRVVGRLENRVYLGQYRETSQFGVGVFADVGRVWAGQALFGQDTPAKVGVGASLLVVVPPRSQRMWRLDLAFPLSADPHAGFEVRVSSTNANRGWQPPPDVVRARAQAIPSSIYTWP